MKKKTVSSIERLSSSSFYGANCYAQKQKQGANGLQAEHYKSCSLGSLCTCVCWATPSLAWRTSLKENKMTEVPFLATKLSSSWVTLLPKTPSCSFWNFNVFPFKLFLLVEEIRFHKLTEYVQHN